MKLGAKIFPLYNVYFGFSAESTIAGHIQTFLIVRDRYLKTSIGKLKQEMTVSPIWMGPLNASVARTHDQRFTKHTLIEIWPFAEKHPHLEQEFCIV